MLSDLQVVDQLLFCKLQVFFMVLKLPVLPMFLQLEI